MRTKVVLHVTRALHRRCIDVTFKLVEDLVVTLAHHVGEHVQPTTVGHAEHCAVHLGLGCSRENRVEDGDRRLGTFKAEPLRTDVLRGQEALESISRIETLQEMATVDLHLAHTMTFETCLHPALFLGVLDVHVLDTNRAAVGIAQHLQ